LNYTLTYLLITYQWNRWTFVEALLDQINEQRLKRIQFLHTSNSNRDETSSNTRC